MQIGKRQNMIYLFYYADDIWQSKYLQGGERVCFCPSSWLTRFSENIIKACLQLQVLHKLPLLLISDVLNIPLYLFFIMSLWFLFFWVWWRDVYLVCRWGEGGENTANITSLAMPDWPTARMPMFSHPSCQQKPISATDPHLHFLFGSNILFPYIWLHIFQLWLFFVLGAKYVGWGLTN